MATLTDGSLTLSVIHYCRWQYGYDVAIGYFCDGIPVLAAVLARSPDGVPPAHADADDDLDGRGGMPTALRPVLTERRPVLWEEDEHRATIIIYPPAFYYAVDPVGSINWDDVLPGLGEDTRQRWLRIADGTYGLPRPDPAHVFMPEEDHPFIVQVKLDPRLLGRGSGSGGLMLELHVKEPVLAAFLTELENDRAALGPVAADAVE